MAWVARVHNSFNASEHISIDLGLSGAYGQNAFNKKTHVEVLDFHLKWSPYFWRKTHTLIWGTEYLQGQVIGRRRNSSLLGLASFLQYQMTERWWIQVRKEYSHSRNTGDLENKVSTLLAFFPSQAWGLRFEYDRYYDINDKIRDTYSLQANFTLGSHPAHHF